MDDEFWELFGEWGMDVRGEPLPLTVKSRRGQGSQGVILSEPVSRPGLPQMGSRTLVRSSDGNELTQARYVYVPPSLVADFTEGSLVTPADGREGTITGVEQVSQLGIFEFTRVTLG